MYLTRLSMHTLTAVPKTAKCPTRMQRFLRLGLLAAFLVLLAKSTPSQEMASAGVTSAPARDGSVSAGVPDSPLPVPVAASESSSSPIPDEDRLPESAGGGQIKVIDQQPTPTHVEQEILIEGLYSYGNYKIFASGYDDKLYTAGVEYDRHSWGTFLKGQMDYVAEFLPFVLLDKPRYTDQWGNPIPNSEKNIRQYVYGIGFSPIGFRLQWRNAKRIRPFLEAKGGMLGFTKKAPAAQAAYENFSLQSMTGVQVKMNEKWGLRLGLFGDFHFSNAFVVPANPGLDVMNANLALSYHF